MSNYTEPQAQVRWTGHYTRTEDGELRWTTSSFETTQPHETEEAWSILQDREGWLPHDIFPDADNTKRGGWVLQHVVAEPLLRLVCSRCGQTGCGGPTDPHE